MREFRVIVVASASNQVICGESASKAPAIMYKRGARDALQARVPRAIARDGGGVRKPLLLFVVEHLVERQISELDAEPRATHPGALLCGRGVGR
jgi:hypothetical protein